MNLQKTSTVKAKNISGQFHHGLKIEEIKDTEGKKCKNVKKQGELSAPVDD